MPLTIACVYPDGSLTGPWFQLSQRLKVAARRGGLAGRVELVPASAVPPDTDVIVAQPLADGAIANVLPRHRAEVVEIHPADHQKLTEFVAWLVTESGAQREHKAGREVAVHRGFQQVGSRIKQKGAAE
jgi:hypothetical protein